MSLQELSIAVTFLTDCYHGEEWPPSPARLYQALVAGIMTCGYARYAAEIEPALRWLENQGPPFIRACETTEGSEYRLAVPNNDMDVVARDWAAGRPGDPAALRTMKPIRPKHLQTEGPHVEYTWHVEGNEVAAMAAPLRQAARCLHALGWGVDVAFADLAEQTRSTIAYHPAIHGDPRAVPMPGTFDDLRATYARFAARASGKGVDTHTRPSMLRMQAYRRADDIYRPIAAFLLMKPEGDRPKAVPWEHCMKVAGWLRHAAAETLRNEYEPSLIAQYVQGHTEDSSKDARISYVPLPSVYGSFSDGCIRRVLIAEPKGAAGEVTRMLKLKLSGAILTDNDGHDAASLAPPDSGDWTFRCYLPESPKKTWRSVTPVVLHGFNAARRGAISIAKTERLLLRAFEMAGYPDSTIESFAFQAAPLWPGSKHASAICVPKHLDGYPRLHAQVQFRRGVRGPVIAGIGRHCGIGLFAAAGE